MERSQEGFPLFIIVTLHERCGVSNHGSSTVCSTVCSGVHWRKHQSLVLLALCEGNPLLTTGLPSQMATNAANLHAMMSSCCYSDMIYRMAWWRHQMKHFPRYWPFVRGIHRSSVNSPHKGQWRGALMFSLICVWINGWVNNREAGDLRRYRAHYYIIVTGMTMPISPSQTAVFLATFSH